MSVANVQCMIFGGEDMSEAKPNETRTVADASVPRQKNNGGISMVIDMHITGDVDDEFVRNEITACFTEQGGQS